MTTRDALVVALVTDVFHGDDAADRLVGRLREARALGAELAVLPELPLNDWCAVRRTPEAADAEPPEGRRQTLQAESARAAGIALLGGAIVADSASGRRQNTALLYDASGGEIARYGKIHLPYEAGFWEADHYEPGDELARPVVLDGFPLGIQICSDVNRPEPTHLLGAMGALAVLAPRATPPESFERWRVVLRANAVTSALYVVSANRPPESGIPVGGPSIAIGPDGEVLLETTEPVGVVTLRRTVVEAAQGTYPGYLALRGDLYARGWAEVAAAAEGGPRRAPAPATREPDATSVAFD
jgi:5-aminopentanamidase